MAALLAAYGVPAPDVHPQLVVHVQGARGGGGFVKAAYGNCGGELLVMHAAYVFPLGCYTS